MLRLSPHTARSSVLLATFLCLPLAACDSKSSPTDASAAADGSTTIPPLGGFGGSSGTGGAPGGSPDARGTGGTTAGTPDGGSQIPIAMPDPAAVKACGDFQTLLCTKLSMCVPGILKAWYGDLATCQAKAPLVCAGQPAVPGSPVTPAMQTACLTAQMAQTCDDFFNSADVPACDYVGTRMLGTPCFSSEQCATGYCSFGSGLCGVCANALKVGSPCQGGDCAPGLQCNGICYAPAKVGEACTDNQLCGIGLYCAAGKCVAESLEGAACVYSTDLEQCSLAADLGCDKATAKCVKRTNVAKGGVCSGTVGCQPFGGCFGAANADTGMCMDLPKQGEACMPNQTPCAKPYFCLQATATTYVCDVPAFPDPTLCN